MTGEGPSRLQFDPQSGAVPEAVGPGAFPLSAGGRVVTLFLGADTDREWAGRTAIELARTWGDSGRRVFLADVCFHSPVLHELLDESASPNLADVILRQAPVEDVVRTVVAGSFLFAPACPADAETPQIAPDVGWEGLVAGFAEVGATVFFFADENVPGVDRIVEASSTVFVLSTSETIDAPLDVVARAGAVLHPPSSGPAKEAWALPAGEPAPIEKPSGASGPLSEEHDELVLETNSLGEPFPEASPAEPPDIESLDLGGELEFADLDSIGEYPPEAAPESEATALLAWEAYLEDDAADPATGGAGAGPDGGRTLSDWMRLAVPGAVVVVLGLLAVWTAWPDPDTTTPITSVEPSGETSVPVASVGADEDGVPPIVSDDSTAPPATGRPAVAGAAVTDTAPPASGDDVPLAYSLLLASYRDAGAARGRAEALGRLSPGVAFMVAPARVNGTIYYRLLAAAPGVDEARALRETIGSVATDDGWLVRWTPVAFELAEVPDLEEARARVEEVGQRGIAAYVVVQNAEGRPTYLVLAGAYRGDDEAAGMRDLLTDAGFPDAPLKPRIGTVMH